MNRWSQRSQINYDTCHKDLQRVADAVLKQFNCSFIEGHRKKQDQDRYFFMGLSQLMWPDSRHNKFPSEAMHLMPWPIDWNDTKRIRYFAGQVVGIGAILGVTFRWGGDWDRDTELKDNTFNDLAHYELVI
jgi:peptidoglycan L-alanyl-D-glutamate endopeptidase CwlK